LDAAAELLRMTYQKKAGTIFKGKASPGQKLQHDIAIAKILVPSNCNQGDTVPVTISLANQGTRREAFTVRLADQTSGREITSQEVTLAKGWNDGSEDVADLVFDAEGTGPHAFGSYLLGGDVNADGYEDLICTGPGYNDQQGRAYIYYGGPNFDQQHDLIITGQASERLGQESALGDFNGDDQLDIALGAMFYKTDKGRVYIYYGGPDIDETIDVIIENPGRSGTIFGRVIAAGDVNNDGYDDLIINANHYDNKKGRAYLYYGGNPFDTIPDKVFDGQVAGERLGRRTAVGDVNGDGCDDILFGTRDYDDPGKAEQTNIGRAYLYYGAPGMTMDTVCDEIFAGEADRDEFGGAVQIADIDSDGNGEILIGARFWNHYQGKIYIWWGGTRNIDELKADVLLYGQAIPKNSNLACDTIFCGDFNHDQYLDVLSGGFNGGGHPGLGFIFYGNSKDSMDGDFDVKFRGENTDIGLEIWAANPGSDLSLFGMEVLGIDLNDDGHDDAVISDPGYLNWQGRMYLYYGPFHDTTNISFNWDTTNASIGKHTLKVEIPPVPDEQNTDDNVKTVTIEVKEPPK
jgi:hypothetical protein